MKNAEKIANITAGLAEFNKHIDNSELAGKVAVGLTPMAKTMVGAISTITESATATIPKELSIAINNENNFRKAISKKAVTRSPCYAVTHSLHSVNSAKIYIYFYVSFFTLQK